MKDRTLFRLVYIGLGVGAICSVIVVVAIVYAVNQMVSHPKDVARRAGQFTQEVTDGFKEGQRK